MTILYTKNRHGPWSFIVAWNGHYWCKMFTRRMPLEDDRPRWYGINGNRWCWGALR